MALLSTLRSWWSGPRRSRKNRRPSQALPRVEPLEQREVPNAASAFAKRIPKQSPNAYAIQEMYQDLLLRGPSLGELANWDSALKGGVSRAQMAGAFVNSQ